MLWTLLKKISTSRCFGQDFLKAEEECNYIKRPSDENNFGYVRDVRRIYWLGGREARRKGEPRGCHASRTANDCASENLQVEPDF